MGKEVKQAVGSLGFSFSLFAWDSFLGKKLVEPSWAPVILAFFLIVDVEDGEFSAEEVEVKIDLSASFTRS